MIRSTFSTFLDWSGVRINVTGVLLPPTKYELCAANEQLLAAIAFLCLLAGPEVQSNGHTHPHRGPPKMKFESDSFQKLLVKHQYLALMQSR
jgi:hypothetical protein